MNQPATPRKPHIIVADTMPERYARGWHVLDKASEFTTKPRMFDVFGTRLAVPAIAWPGKSRRNSARSTPTARTWVPISARAT